MNRGRTEEHETRNLKHETDMPTEPLELHDDRYFPRRRPYAPGSHESCTKGRVTSPIVGPHGHVDPRLLGRERAVPRAGGPPHHPGPLRLPDAVLAGRPARSPRHPRQGRDGGRDGRAEGLADVRRALLPLRRHADGGLARPRALHPLRRPPQARRRFGPKNLRPDPGAAPDARLPAAARSSSASISRSSRRPTPPPTASSTTRRSGRPAGRAASSPCFRPDAVFRIAAPSWNDELAKLEAASGDEIGSYADFVRALEGRRAFFKEMGATSTDHAALTPYTHHLEESEAERLSPAGADVRGRPRGPGRLRGAHADGDGADEPGGTASSCRSTRAPTATTTRSSSSASASTRAPTFPVRTEFTRNLEALPERLRQRGRTSPSSSSPWMRPPYGAGAGAAGGPLPRRQARPGVVVLRLHRRHAPLPRRSSPRRPGIYNTAGFNDDTRAFCSIPARHDLSRRVDAAFPRRPRHAPHRWHQRRSPHGPRPRLRPRQGDLQARHRAGLRMITAGVASRKDRSR